MSLHIHELVSHHLRAFLSVLISHIHSDLCAAPHTGLYKDLSQLKELLSEYRENPDANSGLRPVIAGVLERTGLYEDCPYKGSKSATNGLLSAEEAETIDAEAFNNYAAQLTTYLGVLEARLFSEGLHVLGQKPSASQVAQYLDAYFDKSLPEDVVKAISELPTPSTTEPRVLFQCLLDKLREAKGLEGLGDLGVEDPPFHWYNSLSNEEKYSLSLYGLDLIRFYALKIRRAFGDKEAKKLIEEEVAVNMGTEQDEGLVMATVAKEKRNDVRSKLLEGVEIKRLLEQNDEVCSGCYE